MKNKNDIFNDKPSKDFKDKLMSKALPLLADNKRQNRRSFFANWQFIVAASATATAALVVLLNRKSVPDNQFEILEFAELDANDEEMQLLTELELDEFELLSDDQFSKEFEDFVTTETKES
jgi:hypothetical protein